MKYAIRKGFRTKKREDSSYTRRAAMLFCTFLLVGSFLTVKLYDLAVYDNTSTEVLSGQYSRKRTVATHGGFIYDRSGKLFSHDEAGGIALVNPGACYDKNKAAAFLDTYSSKEFSELLTKLSEPEPFSVVLSAYPDRESPEGIYVYHGYRERENEFCRHLLGYHDADGKGRDGIYRAYDTILAQSTATLAYTYNADAAGGMYDSDTFTAVNRGYTDVDGLVLTLDREIQDVVEKACNEGLDMGAVVVCDLKDFSVAALASRPLYDRENVAASLSSNHAELMNRAFSLYTPGSVFKTVVAAAALEYDAALWDMEYECTGTIDVSGKSFRCHDHDGHGVQTLEMAYANSCNTYFITLADQIGLPAILEMASRLGLGQAHALDGLYVKGARLPSGNASYPPAYLANLSFGQGDLMVSPLDMLGVYAACATGKRTGFSLVRGRYQNGEMMYFSTPIAKTILKRETVESLLKMMRSCVTKGTGRAAYSARVSVGGKTATAQTGQYSGEDELLHTWFAGVFPIEQPRYAVVVLCDGNGNNTVSPARLFKQIAEGICKIE